MDWFRVVVRELLHHRWNSIAGLAAVVLAVGAIVATGMILGSYETDAAGTLNDKQTCLQAQLADLRADISRAMGQLGFNVTILPEGQEAADWYAQDESAPTMPEAYVRRLAEANGPALQNAVGQLRRRVTWPEKNWPVVVVGRGPIQSSGPIAAAEGKSDVEPGAALKEPAPLASRYARPLPPGTVALGYELQKVFGLREGGEVQFMGRTMRVDHCLPQEGSRDDLAVFMPLADAQKLLDQPGRISEIVAQGAPAALEDLPELRRQVARVLPGVQMIPSVPAAVASKLATTHTHHSEQARLEQEQVVQTDLNRFRRQLAGAVNLLVVTSCGLWVGWLAWSNVAERRVEIGIWRACGLHARQVAAIFLGRWLLLGAIGSVTGLIAALAVTLLPGVATGAWQPELLATALVVAVLLSGVAAGVAALAATREDPAMALRSR